MRYKILRLEGAYATLLGDDGKETICPVNAVNHVYAFANKSRSVKRGPFFF